MRKPPQIPRDKDKTQQEGEYGSALFSHPLPFALSERKAVQKPFAQRATSLGIRWVPAVLIDGQLASCCCSGADGEGVPVTKALAGEKNVVRPFGSAFVIPFRTIDQGEERAMVTTTEQAWEAFHAPLHQFIRRRVADEATAEDLLQDVFLKIHQYGSSLKDARRLESWIYQITRNLIIDYYRSRHQTTTSLDVLETIDLPEELPDDDIVSELLPCVRAMVLALPEQDRQALVLTEYQGLTQKELGERLGLSFSGAKSRVQRAREKLKQQLLVCCHFELDRRGYILDYQPRCGCCEQSACCDDDSQATSQQVRPFWPRSVSQKQRQSRGAWCSSHGHEWKGING